MTEPSQDKLMPCPFCGGEAEEGTDDKWGSYVFCCNEETCNALQHNFDSEAYAIAAWNRRPPTDVSTDGLVEEVARAIGAQAEMYDVLLEDEEYAFARAAIATMQPTIEALQRSNAEKDEALRQLGEAVNYAHSEGFEWPSDPWSGIDSKALSHSSDGGNNAV